MSKSKASDKPVKFEEAVQQLEAIIDRIESGEVGLEDCLTQYERGMTLVKQCRTILTKAEQKIAELSPTADGGLTVDDDEEELETEGEIDDQ